MLLKSALPFLLAALAVPRLSAAQTVPTTASAGPAALHRPAFYLGVAAATSLSASPDGFSGTPTGPTTYNHVPLLPKLTLGWQLLPRLALQLSGQYAQQTDSYRFLQGSPDVNGQVAYIPGFHSFRLRSVAVPVLARYTLTHDLARRFQVDLLGGVRWYTALPSIIRWSICRSQALSRSRPGQRPRQRTCCTTRLVQLSTCRSAPASAIG